MSKLISRALPAEVVAGLSGTSPARDQATLLLTVDEDGFPRVSLLSRSEIAVVDDRRMLIALWARSETTSNLTRRPSATLFRIDRSVSRSIRIHCADHTPMDLSFGTELVTFDAAVVDVQADEVGYAAIVSTLDFEVHRIDEVLPRWKEIERHLSERARIAR